MASLHTLKIANDQKVWFTSDYHLFHKNVIKYDNRPFSSLGEMHTIIVENHNSLVGPDDVVVFLGDLAYTKDITVEKELGEILRKLNGRWYYVYGNHDRFFFSKFNLSDKFTKICDLLTVKVEREEETQDIVCCHYSMRVWDKSHHGAWHLYGHSHGNLIENDSKSMDVGIMNNDYFPYSFEEIKIQLDAKPGENFDHHDPLRPDQIAKQK